MSDETERSRPIADGSGQSSGAETRGTLTLSETDAYVGDTIVIEGRNLPANESFDLRWKSVHGEWGVLRAHEIVGPQYRPRTDTITTLETDDSGSFDWEFTIPEDYGGDHTIELVDGDSRVADTEIEVIPRFELLDDTAELGDFFTIRGYGIGPDIMVNNYPIVWDNGYVGFMTGVQNRGTATAEIRAAGPPGKHVLQVWRSHLGIPFLQNNTQSPYGKVSDGRKRTWTVEVTEPETAPRTAWVDDLLQESPIELHYPDLDQDIGATLDITPECGQAGTSAIISGADFPPHTEVDLIWYRHDGHEPQGKKQPPDHSIWEVQVPDLLPTVTTDSDGSFQVEFEIPVDVGSTRPITAAVDGQEVAVTGFMMQPSIETFEPTSGPVGTEIEIELTGVGWTNYETTPMFVYDNDMLGYSCSLSGPNRTKLRTVLRASGQPGYHFIDVYPAIFSAEEDDPNFQLMPHLSYLDNHPVRPLPAAHFCFEVTE